MDQNSKFVNYLDEQTAFSPISLSDEFSLLLEESIKICEEYSKSHKSIQKWYRVTCASCGTFIRGFSEKDLESCDYLSCDCGSDVEVSDDTLSYYFVNPKKKVPRLSQ